MSLLEYLQIWLWKVILSQALVFISCAEERLSLLLIGTFPISFRSGVQGSSWIAWNKKGAVSIWWKQIIKCINCVSTSLQSHLACCQSPIRFLWFYVPKIICSVVNGTEIFAVWFKKIILFSFRSLSGSSSISELPCLFKIWQLRDQLFFWSVFFFLFPYFSESSSLSSTDAGLFTNDEGRQGTEMLFFYLFAKNAFILKLCLLLVVS